MCEKPSSDLEELVKVLKIDNSIVDIIIGFDSQCGYFVRGLEDQQLVIVCRDERTDRSWK